MKVEWVRVGDVLELQRRLVEPELEQSYREIGVRSFGRGVFIKEPRLGSEIGDKRVFSIEVGDLVVSNVFAWEGAVAVAGADAEGTIGSHRFMTWTPVDDRVYAPFVAQFFASETGLELLRGASPGSAGRNRTLSIKNLEDLLVPLPPIDEQRRIAAHLDALSDVSQHRSRLLAATYLARVRERVWTGRSSRLGDLLSLKRRSVDLDPGATHTEIGVRSFGRGIFLKGPTTSEQIGTKRVFHIEPDDLVVSNIFAWEGAVGVADTRHDGAIGSHRFMTWVVRSESLDDVDRRYLANFLVSAAGREALLRASPGSAGRNRTLSIKNFEELRVPLPAIQEQREFAAHLEHVNEAERAMARRNELLDALQPAARNEIFNAMR